MTALIISQRDDVTADRVILELEELGTPVARVDMADFPDNATVTATLVKGVWIGYLHVGDRAVALSPPKITGIYYRRPSAPRVGGESPRYGSAGRDAFLEKEIELGFGGLLAALPERLWLGHPRHLHAVQRSKPWQLTTAHSCGLTVPATMVTGSSRDAAAFAEQAGGHVAIKSFGIATFLGPTGEQEAIHTRRLSSQELREADFGWIAHQVQAWIDASHAIRMAVVDGRLFAAEIHFGSPATRLDWRADTATLTYKRVETPPAVAAGVRRLVERLHLRYAAIDFMVDHGGTWWFLEINANGQWAWIPEVESEIAVALAQALTTPPRA